MKEIDIKMSEKNKNQKSIKKAIVKQKKSVVKNEF